jgi:hypothetical protein
MNRTEKEHDNDYAVNINDEIIYIHNVASGRKGYYCRGCKKEMQAVRSYKERRSYFRHDPKCVDNNHTCHYTSETYRHQLAKEILQRIKRIKVKSVFKQPPPGDEGEPNLLSQSKFIEAFYVGVERYFYENSDGTIICTKKEKNDEKYLLIKPDVVFYNEKYEVILLIEIFATHKISDEKKVKLKRLGIDTVQVIIPKGSPDEIEKTFYRTDNTYWVYNNEQENAEYIRTTKRDSKGIPLIDELQKKFLEESVKCRAAQINNLIRSIGRCLGSKSYLETESEIRSEILRVERNTEKYRQRLDQLRNDHRERAERKYKEPKEIIRSEEKELGLNEDKAKDKHSELEERYYKKRIELEQKEGELDEEEGRLEFAEIEYGKDILREEKSIELRRSQIEGEERDIDETIRQTRSCIETERKYTDELPEQFRQKEEWVSIDFARNEKNERDEIARIQESTRNLPEEFRNKEKELENEYERLFSNIVTSIKNRNNRQDFEFAAELNTFFKRISLFEDYGNICERIKKLRFAKKCIEDGDFKKWTEFKR